MRLAYAYIAPPEAPARANPCPFVRRVFRTLALDLPQTFEVFAQHTGGYGDAAVRFRTPPDREAAMRRQPFQLDGATLTLLRGKEIAPLDEPVSQASASDEAAAAAGAAVGEEGASTPAATASASDEVAASAAAAAEEGASAGEVDGPEPKDLQQQSKALDRLTDHVEGRQLDPARVQSIYEAAVEGASTGGARPDSKDLQQQSKALDKLTDHVEDRQLDSARVQSAMAALASSKEAVRNTMRPRKKELDDVRINLTDVEIIANELELDKRIAERTLREHKGDAVAAVRFLLR